MAQTLELAKQWSIFARASLLVQTLQHNKRLLALIGIALLLRVYAITQYPLNGDEYNTIAEAKHIGLNWQSMLYYVFMHAWINIGVSELLLRLPSTLIDIATVVLSYRLAHVIAGSRAAFAMGLLAASSPFLIFHAQEARFYSLFIFTSVLFIYGTIRLTQIRAGTQAKTVVVLGGLALLFSHFLGLLAIVTQGLALFTAAPLRWPARKRVIGAVLLLLAIFVIPALPPVQRAMWAFYQSFANTTTNSGPITTPISPTNLVKIAITLYVFTFGYHVYPLWWFIVVPGIILTACLAVAGLIRLLRHTSWGWLPILFGVVLAGAYLVLDPIGGRLASGLAARHVAFVWPVYMLVIAIGLAGLRPRAYYCLLCVLVAINIASLYPRWAGTWSYTTLTDYRAAASFASAQVRGKTVVLNDGRAQEPLDVYLPAGLDRRNFWTYQQHADLGDLLNYDRVIFISNDYQEARRQDTNRLLARLAQAFTITGGRTDYPLVEYVLDRKPAGDGAFVVDRSTGQVGQPLGVYGLEFQDLRLPLQIQAGGQTLSILGAFSLSKGYSQPEITLPLANADSARRVVLVSNVTDTGRLASGEKIAELEVTGADGATHVFPIRYGLETQDWSLACGDQQICQTVYQWRKRVAFVGQQSYPGAWRDFQAGMHATSIELPVSTTITKLDVRYTAASGSLNVWGLALAH